MLNKNYDDNECMKDDCEYHFPIRRRHKHVVTPDGSYVQFVVEKPKQQSYSYSNE